MKFRTEIDIKKNRDIQMSHQAPIVMLGSCFTDNVGALLLRDGFNVTANPMGALYNPISISTAIIKSIKGYKYSKKNFQVDDNGVYHCLDFCSQYANADPELLANKVNSDLESLRARLCQAETVILTLGTSYVFSWIDQDFDFVVGNCHKFPASCFNRSMISIDQVCDSLLTIFSILPDNVENLIITVSPIRHIGDGLHGNELSKATLLLGIEKFMQEKKDNHIAYFPSYEIMIDDLRDYRFYAPDMKHPSDVAVEYIYQAFCDTFMSDKTIATAVDARKDYLRKQHRQIIK